jgi:hypothetical protein
MERERERERERRGRGRHKSKSQPETKVFDTQEDRPRADRLFAVAKGFLLQKALLIEAFDFEI